MGCAGFTCSKHSLCALNILYVVSGTIWMITVRSDQGFIGFIDYLLIILIQCEKHAAVNNQVC